MNSLMKGIKPIVKTKHEGGIYCHEDPMMYLLEKGLVIQVGNGLFVLKGILINIFNRIESIICEITESIGAEHALVPSILSWENTQKSNYLDSFKKQALLITSIDKSSGNCGTLHSEFEGIASPTVCYHCFSALKDKIVDCNYAVTAISKCTRKEEGNLNNLARLTNFTMREVVFFGTNEYCLKKLKKVMNKTIKILNSVFDLSYEIVTASDPFFGRDSDMKRNAQLISESKYEIQALIPFNKTTISIGSVNNHGNVFFDRFNIKSREPELKFSGCMGWGYERILYAILAQKGLDFTTSYYKKLL